MAAISRRIDTLRAGGDVIGAPEIMSTLLLVTATPDFAEVCSFTRSIK